MKKYLLAVIFMAIVQMTFGQTEGQADRKVQRDSIIIEFGRTGKILLSIDNKEDFERLKSLDVNQIIRDLNLELDESTGKLHVVEVRGRDLVTVREDGSETEVTVGRIRVLVDESGDRTKVKVDSKPRKTVEPSFRTYFNFDIGINNYLEDGSFPSGGSPYAVRGWGSWNVGLNWMASQRLTKGAYWDFGLGVQWYNFKFENTNYQAQNTIDGVDWILRDDVNGFKSKISASYLTAMTMFKLDFGKLNDSGRNGLRIGVGPYAGYRLGGRSKFVYREPNSVGRSKAKESAGPYLNNLRYGMRGEVGFRSITFYTTYDFNELFQPGQGPSVTPIAFGLVF